MFKAVALLVLCASGLAACGSEGDKECPYEENGMACWHQKSAELCDPLWPETCESGECLTGLLSGSYRPGGSNMASTEWSTQNAICAVPCKIDGDCSSESFDFVNRASYDVQSEAWSCAETEEGRYCAVETTAPRSVPQPDLCDGCEPPFCSGKCVGCPQCP